uniref:Uncharacterized protein n=1 Tax=Tetraselmis sp. GSL018 TaxID=582737 RepID=A0A061RM88_9CHLO
MSGPLDTPTMSLARPMKVPASKGCSWGSE